MRRYGSKQVSKAYNRAALKQCLTFRCKPLGEGDAERLARCYGATVEQVETLAKECGL